MKSSSQDWSLGANSDSCRPMSERKVETLGTNGVGGGMGRSLCLDRACRARSWEEQEAHRYLEVVSGRERIERRVFDGACRTIMLVVC